MDHLSLHTMDRVAPAEARFTPPPSPRARKASPPRSKAPVKTARELSILIVVSVVWLFFLGILQCVGSGGPVTPHLLPISHCVATQFQQPSPFFVSAVTTMLAVWLLDCLFCLIYPHLSSVRDPSPAASTRWFFVHAITNGVVTYFALPDLTACFADFCSCGRLPWFRGAEVMGVATGLHFYHMVFFILKPGDWLHHTVTAVLTTPPILLFQQARGASVALFFMTGLPGGIDYLLLTAVKLGWIAPIAEKKAYVIISVWLRGPGVLVSALIGASTILDVGIRSLMPWSKVVGQIWNCGVTYWNAMYFMHATLSDYYRPGRERVGC
eukprot:TRINITY_DN4064_c0_g1_i1.p1 TRINITY_DN4064_c0_g1~~TRINITY_DN4064_c0_g1_i1.p1  ORF type:complete len:325 (+),score=28.01 TRINITY_DN4064_c0_g1_i1:161-1135(+)